MTVAAEHDVGSALSTSAKIISGFIIFIALCSLFLPIRYFFYYNENYFRQFKANYTYVQDEVTLKSVYARVLHTPGLSSSLGRVLTIQNGGNAEVLGHSYGILPSEEFEKTEKYGRTLSRYSFVPTAISGEIIDNYEELLYDRRHGENRNKKLTVYVDPDADVAGYEDSYAILDNSLPSFVCHLRFLISFIICGGLCVLILRWVVKFTKSVLKRSHTKKLPAEGNPA